MKLSLVICAVITTLSRSSQRVDAWWDNGHLLTAEVATQLAARLSGEKVDTQQKQQQQQQQPGSGAIARDTDSTATSVFQQLSTLLLLPPRVGESLFFASSFWRSTGSEGSDHNEPEPSNEAAEAMAQSVQVERQLALSPLSISAERGSTSGDVTVLDTLLSKWDDEFPGTGTITTAAIWPDLLKCASRSDFCPSQSSPALSLFTSWHFVDIPVAVEGFDPADIPPEDRNPFKKEGQAARVLAEIVESFANSKSKWAWNLQLRLFIHILGDIHQPCHAISGYSKYHKTGDRGCNLLSFPPSCTFPGHQDRRVPNVHSLLDAAGGRYIESWVPVEDGLADLVKRLQHNASEIITSETVADAVGVKKLLGLEYKALVSAVRRERIFERIVEESKALAMKTVYNRLDLQPADDKGHIRCPDDAYFQDVQELARKQIKLGGYRLAIFLTKFAQQYRDTFGEATTGGSV